MSNVEFDSKIINAFLGEGDGFVELVESGSM